MNELSELENIYSKQGKIVSVGLVLSENNGFIVVKSEAKSGCSGCSATGGCGTASLSTLFAPLIERNLLVKNDLNAKVGDKVLLSMVESDLLKHSIMAYGVPLILLMIGAWLGLEFFNSDIVSAILGFIFLILGWLFTKFIYKAVLPKVEQIF